jgi:hypothetical protein
MFWNPANLSDVQQLEMEAVGTGIFPDIDVKLDPEPLLGFPGSDEGNIAQSAFVPAGTRRTG